jgi:hypothetical protein
MNIRYGMGMAVRAMARKRKPAVEGLEVRSLLSVTINNPAGPLTAITIGGDGSLQVQRTGFTSGQFFYPSGAPADAGLFLRQADGIVDGIGTGGNSAAAATRSRQLHTISQTLSADGNSAVTVADNSTDGTNNHFQLTQVVAYHPGDQFFQTDNTILNQGTTPITLDLFAAGDIFLADSDKGVGLYNPTTGAIGGTDATGLYHIFVQSVGNRAPTNYQEDFFNNIWTAIGTAGTDFSNTALLPTLARPPYTNDPNYIDNGAGLEWKAVTINPGQTATISYDWSFGSATTIPNPPSPLTVTASSIQAVEGAPFSGVVASFTSTLTQPQPSDFNASISWGDGTTSVGTITAGGSGGFNVSGGHTYAKAGGYPLSVTVHDNADHTDTAQGAATVSDATLSVAGATFSATVGSAYNGSVATFTDSNPNSAPSDFSATILWGDGTSSAGTISAQSVNSSTVFDVSGTHTYSQPAGTLPTRLPVGIVVNDSGGAVGLGRGAVNVSAQVILPGMATVSGGLAPSSDTGVSNSDGITNINTPTYQGMATPGAYVQITAQSSPSTTPVSLGLVQASSNGEWSLTPSAALPDGTYAVTASAALLGGPITTTSFHALTIDTIKPRVTALSFNPTSGQIVVTFLDDRSGMDLASLTNPMNYSFARQPGRAIFPSTITNVSAGSTAQPTDPVAVTVTINGGATIGHGRRYVFAIASGGVRDVAGNALDGTFTGTFPSGNGTAGAFQARLVSTGGHSLAPLPLSLPFSVLRAPSPHATKVARKK